MHERAEEEREKRERERERERSRESKGSRGSVCAHIRAAGEITSTGSVPVFGIGGKDK